MKVLIATNETQGTSKDEWKDFCFAKEGEIVIFPAFECSSVNNRNQCGCNRAMNGLETCKGTTTFKVMEMPELTEVKFKQMITEAYERWGFTSIKGEAVLNHSVEAESNKQIELINKFTEQFPVGIILQRREGNIITAR